MRVTKLLTNDRGEKKEINDTNLTFAFALVTIWRYLVNAVLLGVGREVTEPRSLRLHAHALFIPNSRSDQHSFSIKGKPPKYLTRINCTEKGVTILQGHQSILGEQHNFIEFSSMYLEQNFAVSSFHPVIPEM